jgi:hypothetical protein
VTGCPGPPADPPAPAPDALVADLRDRLTALGLPVFPGLDAPDRRIDLALGDAQGRGECCWRSTWTARHAGLVGVRLRERQRREALERAGWTFLRVAALDLFCDRAAKSSGSARRGGRRVARCRRGRRLPQRASSSAAPRARINRPDVPVGRPIDGYTPDELLA